MSESRMKDVLDQAMSALRDAGIDPESPLGVAAFPGVLQGVMADRTSSAESTSVAPSIEAMPAEPGSPLASLSEWSGISAGRLADFVETRDKTVVLHVPTNRLPSSTAGRQRYLAYAFLVSMRHVFQMDEVEVDDLNDLLKEYNVMDQNVWGNLSTDEGSFVRRGSRGSYRYRLTMPGRERALEVVQELFGDE
ncbi:MAG: hypothetical protein ACREX3_25435 [Gammaproteobacteria bacterium]